jgi:hypothetical protein
MWVGHSLVLVVLALAPPGEEAATLVEKLGAPRYAEREAAAQALEGLGRQALPALRAGRQSDDPEVRARAAALLGRIESGLMVRPTMIKLDFRDRPLPEVVKILSERADVAMALVPENNPIWQTRRVTLEAPEPVPFWGVLDRLGKAAQLQSSVTMRTGQGLRGPLVQFYLGARTGSVPTSDSGPFRATIHGIHYRRDRTFAQNGAVSPPAFAPVGEPAVINNAGRGGTEQFYADLQIAAEPRMVLTQSGPLKLTEALDDRGRALIPAASAETVQRMAGYYGTYGTGVATLQMQVHLRPPQPEARTIKRLRGVVPVVVAARKDDPLVIDLAQGKGKAFQSDEMSITIHDVRTEPDQPRISIELSLRPNVPSDPSVAGGRFAAEMMAFRSPQMSQSQIEILDAQGRVYAQWFPSSNRIDAEEMRMTIMLLPNEQVGPPTQLRFYDLSRATAEANFEFHDVPMP